MERYYQFADQVLRVDGLPEWVHEGSYLSQFRCPASQPSVTLAIRRGVVTEKLQKHPCSRPRYFVRGGTLFLASELSYALNAVIWDPSEWKHERISVTVHPGIIDEEIFTVNQLLSLSGFSSGLLYRRCGMLHCSYIVVGDRAVLFAGFSGAGKSTQAELWRRERGAEIINGDRALIFPRADGWYAGGVSVCGSSKICRNRTAKVAAIVLLEKGPENAVLQLTAGERYRAVLAGLAFHRWSAEETELAGQLAMDIISAVPTVRLRNRADLGAVEALEAVIGGLHEDNV